jgi:hypothetical protein
MAVAFLKESLDPTLTSPEREDEVDLQTHIDCPEERLNAKQADIDLLSLLSTHLQRPFRMLATQTIIQLIAMYMALLYGTMFLFLYMYAMLWDKQYGQSPRTGSLNYISAAIGYVLGVQSKCELLFFLSVV